MVGMLARQPLKIVSTPTLMRIPPREMACATQTVVQNVRHDRYLQVRFVRD
jgi:hypothetical protein